MSTPIKKHSPHTTIQVAVAIIVNKGLTLIGRIPKGKLFADQWEFPGGKLEAGESAEQAVRREIWEEFRTELNVQAQLPPLEYEYPEISVTLNPFICSVEPQLINNVEHSEIRWSSVSELSSTDLVDADKELVRLYVSPNPSRENNPWI